MKVKATKCGCELSQFYQPFGARQHLHEEILQCSSPMLGCNGKTLSKPTRRITTDGLSCILRVTGDHTVAPNVKIAPLGACKTKLCQEMGLCLVC